MRRIFDIDQGQEMIRRAAVDGHHRPRDVARALAQQPAHRARYLLGTRQPLRWHGGEDPAEEPFPRGAVVLESGIGVDYPRPDAVDAYAALHPLLAQSYAHVLDARACRAGVAHVGHAVAIAQGYVTIDPP
jgi:hypothetical protein